MNKFSVAKKIAYTSLFSALCLVCTLFISIPFPVGHGYFNLGDTIVLLGGWLLGGLYGAISAGVGSALADILGGYAIYAPATFVIKAVDAFVAYLVCRLLKKVFQKKSVDFIARALSAIVGETLMVLGYLLYETILYGFAGACLALVGNLTQGVIACVLATALFAGLYPIPRFRAQFQTLKD